MKRPPRKTAPDIRRRALELLATHPNGCPEAILAAQNIPAEVLINLVRGGLTVARSERFEDDDGAVG
jgi:putative heme iron utilization protein